MERFRAKGIIDSIDAESVSLFAATWEDFEEARADVRDRGREITVILDGGIEATRKNPSVDVMQSARMALNSQMSNLGIGPRNRAAVQPASEPDDPAAEFNAMLKAI